MFNPNRDEARTFLFDAWKKFRAEAPLTALEAIAVDVIRKHPEYHPQLDHPEKFAERDYAPEAGETNPFLHLFMHIGIHEQLSIDQPAGVRAAHAALTQLHGDTHKAEHDVMDCMAEMIWQAQRTKSAFDAGLYLNCLAKKQGKA